VVASYAEKWYDGTKTDQVEEEIFAVHERDGKLK
jgi:hypothetical protein